MKFYDYIIIDAIKDNSDFSITKVAMKMNCPRSFITARLESLLNNSYIEMVDDLPSLTEKGRQTWFPVGHLCRNGSIKSDNSSKYEFFDWTSLYIPKPENFND